VVTTSIATDPRWDDYRALRIDRAQGLLVSPIKNHEGQVVGTFAFYFKEPREPNALHKEPGTGLPRTCAPCH
jgi:GAF domain-containing protein